MPVLWRFLLANYFKVFCLSVLSFLLLLLVTRLDEIAQFAALGAPLSLLGLFSLYQMLYILPIAIPVSGLIASILLFHRLSESSELTAMRSSGMSLKQVLAPILLSGLLLSFLNFYIVSEWSTSSHLSSKKMVNDLKLINPLFLLQNKQLLRLKDAYVDISALYAGEVAHDALIVLHNQNTKRLNFMAAKTLRLSKQMLFGDNVSLVSSLDSNDPYNFDHLIIENQRHIASPASDFSNLLSKNGWQLNNDHLPFRFLLIRTQEKMQELLKQSKNEERAELKKQVQICFSEIARRFSSALAVFSFTLMGTAFGIYVERMRSKSALIWVLFLAAFFLSCYFAAKSFEHLFFLSSSLYFLPQILLISLSLFRLRCINQGIPPHEYFG